MTSQFWDRLTSYEGENVFNPWSNDDPHDVLYMGATARKWRLEKHFDRDARYLLIGEAPGYRGCHFSGIPFTCEKQLCDGIVPVLGRHERITTRNLPWSEGSATIIWSTLYELDIAESTVMFNAFPWHPHQPGDPLSNRTPTARELTTHADVLGMVVREFPDAKRIAVGKAAAGTLGGLGFQIHHEVRHPSMGGANLFRQQMRELVGAEQRSAA